MATENIQKFEELLRSDEGVQAKLRAAVDAFEGDKADEQAFFEATVGKVADELGFSVTYDEVKAYAGKLTKLNDAELSAVAGGDGYCFIIGIHTDVDASACPATDENGAQACAFAGIGFLYT